MAFGVNDFGAVVGTFMRGTGNNAKSFGFVWQPGRGVRVVNDPLGRGATTLNGINDAGDLVGFYTDAKATPTACWCPAARSARPPPRR